MGTTQKTKSQSKETGTVSQTAKPIVDPAIKQSILGGFDIGAQEILNRISRPLDLQFQTGSSNSIDPLIARSLAANIQDSRARSAGQQRGTAQALSRGGTGSNNALLAALNRSSQIANAGSENALRTGAIEAQRGLDLQNAQQLGQNNQQLLAARQLSTSELAPALGLLQLLSQFGLGSAEQTSTKDATSESTGTSVSKKRGGLFGL